MFEDIAKVRLVLDKDLQSTRLLVVGDLMLDGYLWGEVSRISPEAPVPVVRVSRRSFAGGGAGNVALNLASLGVTASVIGVIGDDTEGETLRSIFETAGIDHSGTVVLEGHETTTKTRVISEHQQMLRIDRETVLNLDPRTLATLEAAALDALEAADAVILSDYAKGVLPHALCKTIIERSRSANVLVFVDPKGTNYEKYGGATVLMPNRNELAVACDVSSDNLESLLAGAVTLRERLGTDFIVATLGEKGMALVDSVQCKLVPTVGRRVFDVSGAGDTAMATLASAIVGGLDPLEAVRLANVAAGLVVSKVGTVCVTAREISAALISNHDKQSASKCYTLEALREQITEWRSGGAIVTFTNGCFDLLHAGHVEYLEKAAKLGSHLIVALNSDDSVRQLKGKDRPFVSLDDRCHVVAGLSCVDAVIIFDAPTPLDLIMAFRPDVLVKGGDFADKLIVGSEEVKSWGGRVEIVPFVAGKSTTNLVRSIRKSTDGEGPSE